MLNGYDMPKLVRKILPHIDADQLKKDLKTLRSKAIEAGAVVAAVINAEDVVFNPDVSARVDVDKHYPSIHWPLSYIKDDLEESIRAFQNGIFIQMGMDTEMPEYGGGPIIEPTHRQIYLKLHEVVTLLESMSFYMGYHLALGFATGNCRSIFCNEEKLCLAMLKGRGCVQPYKGRPSMEAAGIDATAIARKLKWKASFKKSTQLLFGLVMVA